MQEKDHCRGLMGRLYGHQFESRYDTDDKTDAGQKPSEQSMYQMSATALATGQGLAEMIAAGSGRTSKSTYVHDVCVRCGKVIQREETNATNQ